MRIRQRAAMSAFLSILVTACATTQPIPELSQPQSSGLGIDVTLKAPVAIFTAKPDQVFFARIDGEDGLFQQQIIRSNYCKDGRAYLLNARPGTYVAVAAFFFRTGAGPAAPARPGFSVTVQPGSSGYTTYFSQEIVEHTKVVVRENDFAFAGSYVVSQSVGLDGADKVQAHYKNVIAPGATTNVIMMGLGGDVHYRGAAAEVRKDDANRSDFLSRAREDLAESAWAARLK